MKKSTFFAVSAIFIVFFIVNTLGNKVIPYKKELNFKTPEEAIENFIEYINIYDEINNNGITRINNATKEFKESISKRYRFYCELNSNNSVFNQVPIFENYELSEISLDENKNLNNEYIYTLNQIPNYIKPNEIRAFSLIGEGIYGSYSRNDYKSSMKEKLKSTQKTKINILFVVVDEGEGYVVDYYMTNWEE